MMSDPGSQLESAAGKMLLWWLEMEDTLMEVAGKYNFSWETIPANSPWRQGKCERRIRVVKMLIKIAIGDCKLSQIEIQTVPFKAANLCNERPIGINKQVQSDGTYQVLTPNCLMMGRAENKPMRDELLESKLLKAEHFKLVQVVTKHFWSR